MARNEEKAQSMLNRYLQSKKAGERDDKRRPYLSTLCDDVDEAEKWRKQVLRDIRRRVEEIQNPGLDDARIRELNDNINKLLRERGHWDRRIRALGGRDYTSQNAAKRDDDVGKGAFQHRGVFFFGAARNLPEVKELMKRRDDAKQAPQSYWFEESAATLRQRVGRPYYDLIAADDEDLQEEEAQGEQKLVEEMVRKWEENHEGDANAPWDDSYVQYIGKKPDVSAAVQMEALLLESRKAEALEQLERGLAKR